MIRKWEIQINMTGCRGNSSTVAVSTFETYKIRDVMALIHRIRDREKKEGLPRRKLKPIYKYVLDDVIKKFWDNYAVDGHELVSIVIKDTKENGL